MNIMKRIILYLMFLALSLSVSAQQSVKFMGIPITDTYDEFVEKLAEKMHLDQRSGSRSQFSGTFAGMDSCCISVSRDPNHDPYKTDLGWIIVCPHATSYQHGYVKQETIENIVSLYSQKYGQPEIRKVHDAEEETSSGHILPERNYTFYGYKIEDSYISVDITEYMDKKHKLTIWYYITDKRKDPLDDI